MSVMPVLARVALEEVRGVVVVVGLGGGTGSDPSIVPQNLGKQDIFRGKISLGLMVMQQKSRLPFLCRVYIARYLTCCSGAR